MASDQHEQPENRAGDQSPRMALQPALQTSSGTIWLVMGALFAAVSMIPLVPLIFVNPGPSFTAALVTAALILLSYAAIVAFRLIFGRGRRRLRWMAGALITMAAVGIIGMLACLWIENAAARLG